MFVKQTVACHALFVAGEELGGRCSARRDALCRGPHEQRREGGQKEVFADSRNDHRVRSWGVRRVIVLLLVQYALRKEKAPGVSRRLR